MQVLDRAPSTNALLAEQARRGEPSGAVLVAEHQTAGRGRLDRTWEAPARAGLTVSVLLRPGPVPAQRWGWLPLLTGVAVVDALGEVAPGLDAGLKWPNDVLVGERKLAGLLVERVEGPDGPGAVVGIGLNVSTTADELPVPTATSLLLEGVRVDRTDLLVALLEHLGRRYQAWVEAAGDARLGLRAAYRERCRTLGQAVTVELPAGRQREVTAVDVAEDGALVVEAAGVRSEVRAGDVVHVRRA